MDWVQIILKRAQEQGEEVVLLKLVSLPVLLPPHLSSVLNGIVIKNTNISMVYVTTKLMHTLIVLPIQMRR